MKVVVAAFNQEKALVGAFSVITNRMELFEALLNTQTACQCTNICFKVLCTCFVTLYAQSLHILTFNRKYRTSTVKIHFHIYGCMSHCMVWTYLIHVGQYLESSKVHCISACITYFRSLPPLAWVWRGLSRGPETSRDWGRLASPPQPHSSPGSVPPAEGRNLSPASGLWIWRLTPATLGDR